MFGTSQFFDTLKREGPRLSAVVIALGALYLIVSSGSVTAAPLGAPAPDVTALSPGEGYNSQSTEVTITGLNFTATPTVTLGTMPLTDVGFVSTTTLTATVPADLPGGTYAVTVTNPDNQNASLVNGFTVLLTGDGSLNLWESTSSMTTARIRHAAVQAGGYLYALGGEFGGGTILSSVERAAIDPDGSVGQWESTNSMTMGRIGLAAVTTGGYIYAIGGDDLVTELSSVERAAINPDGSLGPWATTTSMTTGRANPGAVTAGGYIYAVGGEAPHYTTGVERAKISLDGSLGNWEAVASMKIPRANPAAVVVGSYLYALGGQGGGSPSLDSVERAVINLDGSLGNWETVNSLTKPNCGAEAVAAGGYIYALGGSSCIGGTQPYHSVHRALVNADGSLGLWKAVFSMTVPRNRFAAARRDRSIYAIGGQYHHSTLLGSAEYSEITEGMLPTGQGVSINDGALFTNEVTVTLTIGADPDTREAQVSNDGGFAGAAWESYAQEKTWQITRYGNYVIPRVVYVRYKVYDGKFSSAYPDDIILDVTAPSGSVEADLGLTNTGVGSETADWEAERLDNIQAANIYPSTVYLPMVVKCYPPLPTGPANVTLRLSATDDVSGVGTMMISNRPDLFCADWETYATSKPWYVPKGTTTIYVLFKDNAGNVSPVATDTIAR